MSVKQGGFMYHFLSFWYDDLGLNPGLLGPLWDTLPIRRIYVCVCVCVCVCIYRERETYTERKKDRKKDNENICIYIYIYMVSQDTC